MNLFLNRSQTRVVALGLLAMLNSAAAGADALVVRPQDADSGVFGGTQVERVYRIEGQGDVSAVLGWSLVAHRRTLARGETMFAIKSDGSVNVSVPLSVPPVNEGVILAAELTVSVYGGDFSGDAAIHNRPLWIFPRSAFAGRSDWLRSLDIVLFDPSGETAAVFDQTEIPYRQVERPQELLSGGLAVVGEGLAIDEYAGLSTAAFTAARQGTSVLWLSPSTGRFALPGTREDDGAFPRAMTFRGVDVVTELDGRLDREIWTATNHNLRTMRLRCDQANVVVELGTDREQWPWFQVQYAEPEAKLVVCGLPLIARWEESPTPRFLLLRILEDVNDQ